MLGLGGGGVSSGSKNFIIDGLPSQRMKRFGGGADPSFCHFGNGFIFTIERFKTKPIGPLMKRSDMGNVARIILTHSF